MHINLERGLGLKALTPFIRHGGRNIVLINLLTKYYVKNLNPTSIEPFKIMYKKTLETATLIEDHYRIQAKVNVRVYAVLGPHPAEITERLRLGMPLEDATKLVMKAIDLACEMISKEKKAIALGEVGRPHYPVPRRVWIKCNEVFKYALTKANQLNIPVQIHMEELNEDSLNDILAIIDEVGFKRNMAIIHHARPLKKAEKEGLILSVTARRKLLEEALKKLDKFLLETDYLDDPRRPGAVLSPRALALNVKRAITQGILSESKAYEINVKIPEEIYKVPFHD